eukprot:GHVQ01035654.1.p1 GENE.GHVQ01035654.1~~GHVQ01035654.1.p1  ORF type:complete len:847 (+),score=135.48 GHVQ01035654.1:197-2737(+)
MLGYPTQFGQLECLKLIASPKFTEKRVGYLGLTCLLDENAEVLMLVTNSIKNDLNHPNQYINGLALCALGNIASEEMCRALSREVEMLLGVSNPYIRKKAALCAMRMIRKVEDIEDKFNGHIGALIDDRSHGVVLAGCSLLLSLLEQNSSYLEEFRQFVPQLIHALKGVLTAGYSHAAEYDVGGITDPFLQVKILRLLRVLGKGSMEVSDEVNDILAEVATNTEGAKNVGNAILYECVQSIMNLESEEGLRVLGINILGRFLQNRDNNIRYVALSTLQHVVQIDLKVVQRHRAIIVDCLKDADVSIRKRALDVSCALTNEDNIKTMTKELLNYLLSADKDFKADLVTKICVAVDRFSPNRRWQVDTLIKVFCLAGNFVQAEVRDSFLQLVSASPELHTYAVTKLFFSVRENLGQLRLVEAAVWCIGEFGDLLVGGGGVGVDEEPIDVTPSEVMDLLDNISNIHGRGSSFSHHMSASTSPTSSAALSLTTGGGGMGVGRGGGGAGGDDLDQMLVMCIIKLASRLPTEVDRIKTLLQTYERHMGLEIQQRACEYQHLLERRWDKTRDAILDRMPTCEKAIQNMKAKRQAAAGFDGVSPSNRLARTSKESGGGAAASSGLVDLLELDTAAAPTSIPAGGSQPGVGGGDLLEDLLGGLSLSGKPEPPKSTSTGLDVLSGVLGPNNAHGSSPAVNSSALNSATSADSALDDLFCLGVSSAGPTGGVCQFPDMPVFEKGGVGVVFRFHKERKDSTKFDVTATYTNKGPNTLTDFVFEVAVPKYLTLDMKPASSSTLAPNCTVTQQLHIDNSALNQKPVLFKVRLSYQYVPLGSLEPAKVQEFLNVANFPQGL